MSEIKLISPMLDDFDVGGSISSHNGVSCYPAMKKNTDDRFIVKVVSIPASQTQLDALLLSGAFPDVASAVPYFRDLADATVNELEILQKLSQLEGFLPYDHWQVATKEDSIGFDVYMIGTYKRTLRKHFQRQQMTHLMAVNLGLDLCAALAVCRRCGYMHVDLKPSNIYVVNDREFRIGDLGFIKLDSLKYASIPDKYRSEYSAPELNDPFAPLNDTLDIYAAGLILYQAYNGGELPFAPGVTPDGRFDAPLYADYEMSEIILKACDPNPEARWQDPVEMGQAIVSYMQRNGANDTPIITASVQTSAVAEDANSEIVSEIEQFLTDDDIDLSDIDLSDIPELDSYSTEEVPAEELPVEETELTTEESPVYTEDDSGNLSFLDDISEDETSPENNISDVAYDEVTDELSDILSQADELVSHPVPEPVVAPDAQDINLDDLAEDGIAEDTPPAEAAPVNVDIIDENGAVAVAEEAPAVEAVDTAEDVEAETEQCEEAPVHSDSSDGPAFEAPAEEDEEVVAAIAEAMRDNDEPTQVIQGCLADDEESEDEEKPAKKSSNRVLRNIIIFLLLAIIAVAGFLYFRYIYLQPVYSIMVDGDESSMVVLVDTDTDETLLSVLCTDAHGNQLSAPVNNGTATFANLAPDTAYNVEVIIDGFHRLTGETSASYTTPALTNIVQFTAVTGREDGSAIINFTTDGPDTKVWSLTYSAADEAEKTVEMLSNMITVNGLTIGKEYTFTLVPGDGMYITGTNQITHTASKVVVAKEVNIDSCIDGKLTATWIPPEDVAVEEWTVRCYIKDGEYMQTITTTDTVAVFEGVDPAFEHIVEVTAKGMSECQWNYMPANAITISNFLVDDSNPSCLNLTWESSSEPNGGWVVLYSIEGSASQGTVSTTSNSAQIKPCIPGETYTFTIQQASGDATLTTPLISQAPEAQDFSGYGMTRNTIDFALCQRPGDDWTWDDVPSSGYTNNFAVGENISLVGNLQGSSVVSDDVISTLYVFRDQDGNLVCYSFQERSWRNMWSQSYGEFDVPQVPNQAGKYTLSIYFNGKLVTEETVNIQ